MEDIGANVMETEVDWRSDKSLPECLTYLSQNKSWYDVTFAFPNDGGKLLHGHRLILSLRSPVFEAMFFGLLADKRDTVDIEDIEHDIFDHILRYSYTDETNLTVDNVIPILYGAKKYCLSGLVKACSLFLESSMTCDNVCTIYEHAKMFDMEALLQTCLVFMSNNSSAVCQSENSTCLSHESLLKFIASECLRACEVDHFRLINNWAVEKCKSQNMEPSSENKRDLLGEIIFKVNYSLMTPEEFSEIVVPTNILLAEDQVRVLQYMVTGNKTHIDKYSFPARNNFIFIDTRNLEGPMYYSDRFVFIFRSSANLKLLKLLPLKLGEQCEFGRKDLACISISNTNTSGNIEVPVTLLDESGSLTKGFDMVFAANTKYVVSFIMHSNHRTGQNPFLFPVKREPSIPTLHLNPPHTTKIGLVSCTIERIPKCVETVEFEVLN